jgi:enterochelin esterase family protein
VGATFLTALQVTIQDGGNPVNGALSDLHRARCGRRNPAAKGGEMRLAAIILTGIVTSAAWGSDAFVGDWKLNAGKSVFTDGRAIKDGRALIEPDNRGGYLQFSESIFSSGPGLRFSSRVQFDGTAGDGTLEERPVQFTSKRIASDAFEISVRDRETDQMTRTVRISVAPQEHVLTIAWADGKSAPLRKLVYEKAVEGPLLEAGKTIEHAFGPAAVFEYRVALRAGEYCQGTVDQKGGSINIGSYGPDGSRLHNVNGSPTGIKTFSLEAPLTGTYRLVLRSAASPAESFAIKVDKIVPSSARPHGEPAKEKFPSPRIAALRKKVESGDTQAIAAFWREVEKEGTPIVERMEDNDKDNLVTFLWRGSSETHNVFVLWFPFAASKPADYQLARFGEADLWYRTLKIRRGARFAYQLSPNDPLVFDEQASIQRSATAQADPLNPHHWMENPGGTKYEYQSSLEMPDAKPQPYVARRDGVPAGKIEKKRIKSALLGNERDLSIYTPPGYRRDGAPNGLLVVFDESAYLTLVPTPVILDNLLAEKKIAPMVAVLIANPNQETRTRELPPNPAFADFLNNELVAWVRANYNVTKDPSQVVVAGSSFGGIASVYAGLRHPETFGNILCQSGSFWWSAPKPEPYAEPNFLAKEFVKSPKLPLKFYMDAGSFEVDMNGGGGAILEPSRHMRDVLLAKGYEVHYQENVGGHDYLSWRGSLADGLLALVGTAK